MNRWKRGTLVVIGMFLFGGAVLAGLFLAPRPPAASPAPAAAQFGVPRRPLKVVSYNILHNQRGAEGVVQALEKIDADFILLQEVEHAHIVDLAAALGLEKYYLSGAYQPSANLAGADASWGNCILSKYPLFEAGSIPNPGGGSFGIWAVALVDDRKFLIADVHLSATWNANPLHITQSGENRSRELTALFDAWHARGAVPMIVGGDFNQLPAGNNYAQMTRQTSDALASLGKTATTFAAGLLHTRIDYVLLTPQWKAIDGGIGDGDASDHSPIWAIVQPAGKEP
jgi:endonuclease/exonuclease/phosphatase family metal-dependent hydrolase